MVERVGAAESIEDATRWILDVLEDVIPAGIKAFILLEDDGATLRIRAATGLDPEFIGRFERRVGTGPLADVVWSGHALGVRDAEPASEQYKDFRLDLAYASGVAAPVSAAGRHFGYLWVQSDKEDAYDLTAFNIVALCAALAGEVISHMQTRMECALHVPIDLETGLLRQLEFARRLSGEVERARRGDLPVSVIVMRLDGLHQLKAVGGRALVVDAIKDLARVVRGTLRGIDLLGSGGPDRMEACLPDTAADDAVRAAERVRSELVKACAASWPEYALVPDIGVAAFPDDADDSRALMARAVEAAVMARKDGEGRVTRYVARA
jgi:diguanylate cyclase (GGDEF)-like protein